MHLRQHAASVALWRCTAGKPAGAGAQACSCSAPGCVTTIVACVAGTGSFGRVKLVRSATDGRFYALKVLRKTDLLRLKQVRAAALPLVHPIHAQ